MEDEDEDTNYIFKWSSKNLEKATGNWFMPNPESVLENETHEYYQRLWDTNESFNARQKIKT